MNALQERQWVEAARKGDQAAFEQLVRAYEKRVFALTLRMCGSPEDAAEAAQETFSLSVRGRFPSGERPAFLLGCTAWRPTPVWTSSGGKTGTGPPPVPP